MFRRGRTTTSEERPVSTSSQQPGYVREVRQEPVSAPPRGNGQAVREEERMVGREPMMEPRRIGLGQYLANWFTLLIGSALVLAEALLGLRLFFKLASADNTNWVVKFTYHLSGVAIRPFTDVIRVHELFGGIFEPSVVISMVLYAVGAILAIWIIRSLASLRSWGSALIPR